MTELLEAVNAWDSRWVLVALLLVLDVWAIGLIVRARPAPRVGLLWSAIVLLCPSTTTPAAATRLNELPPSRLIRRLPGLFSG